MTKEASNRIYWIRLICAVMVVGIHSENGLAFQLPADSISWKIQAWITNNIYCVAVPIFFILSGFFCFYNKDEKQIMGKYKHRILKMAYLYLLWNMIYMCYHYLKELLASGGNIQIRLNDILKGIFLYEYNNPWWFMFQLLILEVMTPLFIYTVKTKKIGILFMCILLGILFMNNINIINIPYIRFDAFVWYFFGIYVGRYKEKLLLQKEEGQKHIALFCIIFGEAVLYMSTRFWNGHIRCLSILILSVGALMIYKTFGMENKIPDAWKASFFIYALHPLLIAILQQMERIIIPITEKTSFVLFIINPFMVVCIILTISRLIGKTCLYRILVAE